MKTRTITPFFLIFIIIALTIPNVKGAYTEVNVGSFPIYGLSAYNPANIYVWNKDTNTTQLLAVYCYGSGYWPNKYYLKVWDVNTSQLILDTDFNPNPATYSYLIQGIAIYQTVGVPYDGFYVVAVRDMGSYFSVEVYFANMTTKTVATLNYFTLGSAGSKNGKNLLAFSNMIRHGGFDYFAVMGANDDTEYKIHVGICKLKPSSLTSYTTPVGSGGNYFRNGVIFIGSSQMNPDRIVIVGYAWNQDSAYRLEGLYKISDNVIYNPTYNGYAGFNNWLPRGVEYYTYIYANLMKFGAFQGAQYPDSKYEYFMGTIMMARNDLGETIMYQLGAKLKYTQDAFGTYIEEQIYKINGIVYPCDLRTRYSTTNFYVYYMQSQKIFNVEWRPPDSLAMGEVKLSITPNEYTYIYGGYGYMVMDVSNKQVTIYVMKGEQPGEGVPVINPPTPPEPGGGDESTAFITETVVTAMGFIVPFLFMFLPGMILGEQAGTIGLIVGLALGGVMLYLGGLIPVWVVILFGLGLVALIFFGREKIFAH